MKTLAALLFALFFAFSVNAQTVPPAASVTDAQGAWTLGTQINGQAPGLKNVLLNGSDIGGWVSLLSLTNGAVRSLGADGCWWVYAGTWSNTNDCGVAQPPPPQPPPPDDNLGFKWGPGAYAAFGSTASGINAYAINGCIALGTDTRASGTDCLAVTNQAQALRDGSVAVGFRAISDSATGQVYGAEGTTRGIDGAIALSAGAQKSQIVSSIGSAQKVLYIMKGITTDATPAQLTTYGGYDLRLAVTNQITLPNNSIYAFEGDATAGDTSGLSKTWKFKGSVKRGSTPESTLAVVEFISIPQLDSVPWSLVIGADTFHGALGIIVTGENGREIPWVVSVETTENVR